MRHEFKHLLQAVRAGGPAKKIKQKQEIDAIVFSADALREYVNAVGGEWCCEGTTN